MFLRNMVLAEAEAQVEAEAEPRLGTAWHEAQCVAQFVAPRRRGGAFGCSGRRVADRDGRVARSTLGFIAPGQGRSNQVKPFLRGRNGFTG